MLKKEQRMGRSFFKGLTKPLKSFQGDFFVLKIFAVPSLKSLKFAISVSKKQEKKAVLRNKIRRVAYKTIGQSLRSFEPGFAYHFILKQKPKNITKDIKDVINKDILNLIP